MFGLVTLLVVISIVTSLWWWQKSARSYWEDQGISYISGPPLIGALKDTMLFKQSFAKLFSELYDKFKDDAITGVYFFHKPSLIVRHPEIIKNILMKDFQHFIDRAISTDPVADKIGWDGMFVAKGAHWKNIRNKVTPIFTTGKLKNFFQLMEDVNNILEEKFTLEIGEGSREYEMKELASQYTTEAIAICAFGVKANCLMNKKSEFYVNARRATDFTWRRAMELTGCFLLPELATLLRFTVLSKETNNFLRSTVNYVMEQRVKSGTKRNDLIDTLIAMGKIDEEMHNDTLIAQAGTFLIAGSDTSSSALSFVLFELARHPDVQEKLRREIRAYLEKYGSVQYDSFNEMEYLHCVMQETLRLYPPLPFLDRVCYPTNGEESYSLEPYHKFSIPKGMPVYIPIISIQRNAKYFENPDQFIPERFSTENRNELDQYSFLSFGTGPRSCIGSRFAYLQVKFALVTILRNYKVEANENTPSEIVFEKKSLLLQSDKPLYLNLTRI